jgi:diguanylate cyclase (GGDEF)-like protein
MNEPFLHRPKILIVDDVTNNIEILLGALERDYDTQFATSGAEALDLIENEKPDLILLDVMMPGMDGYEVCRRLKDAPTTQNIPIIFVSARDAVQDQERGFNLGAVDYITKPYELSILRARVRTHVTLKRKSDLLEALVSLDGLTGIPNRRRFDETLKSEWRRAIRERIPLALIMADVDQFKNYNDFYGHGSGDDCLREVAQCLMEAVQRPGDLAARYGGEEFAAILPDCDSNGAYYVAERFRNLVAERGIAHVRSAVAPHVTISAGVAARVPVLNESSDDLLKQADQALYQAKWNGRNQVYNDAIE